MKFSGVHSTVVALVCLLWSNSAVAVRTVITDRTSPYTSPILEFPGVAKVDFVQYLRDGTGKAAFEEVSTNPGQVVLDFLIEEAASAAGLPLDAIKTFASISNGIVREVREIATLSQTNYFVELYEQTLRDKLENKLRDVRGEFRSLEELWADVIAPPGPNSFTAAERLLRARDVEKQIMRIRNSYFALLGSGSPISENPFESTPVFLTLATMVYQIGRTVWLNPRTFDNLITNDFLREMEEIRSYSGYYLSESLKHRVSQDMVYITYDNTERFYPKMHGITRVDYRWRNMTIQLIDKTYKFSNREVVAKWEYIVEEPRNSADDGPFNSRRSAADSTRNHYTSTLSTLLEDYMSGILLSTVFDEEMTRAYDSRIRRINRPPSLSIQVQQSRELTHYQQLFSNDKRKFVEVWPSGAVILTEVITRKRYTIVPPASTPVAPYRLSVLSSGNLVVYNGNNVIHWESDTAGVGTGPYRAMLLGDCTFGMYDSRNIGIWKSSTTGLC